MKLYQYAVIKDERTDDNGKVVEKAKVVVDVTTILAKDNEQATLLAARAIPDEHMDDLERLQVVVRPF